MARCSVCGKPAIARVPYARRSFCREHYAEFIESKVERAVRKYKMARPGDLVVAAISGGKDRSALLGTLKAVSERIGFEVVAFHIDLGIGDYSKASRKVAEQLARSLGVPLVVYSLEEEIGAGVPQLAFRLRRPPCSVCGAVKRYLYNAAAIEAGARALATGHNADDIIAFSMKNFLVQDLEAIGKLAPVTPGIPGLAAKRIRPLYTVYEKEAFLYVLARRLPFLHDECPHADLGSLEFNMKRMINKLEEERPSLKLGFLSQLAKRTKDYPKPREDAAPCAACGLISSQGKCSFCRITEKIHGTPLGPVARRRLREMFREVLRK